jgi:hypothetical protein
VARGRSTTYVSTRACAPICHSSKICCCYFLHCHGWHPGNLSTTSCGHFLLPTPSCCRLSSSCSRKESRLTTMPPRCSCWRVCVGGERGGWAGVEREGVTREDFLQRHTHTLTDKTHLLKTNVLTNLLFTMSLYVFSSVGSTTSGVVRSRENGLQQEAAISLNTCVGKWRMSTV